MFTVRFSMLIEPASLNIGGPGTGRLLLIYQAPLVARQAVTAPINSNSVESR